MKLYDKDILHLVYATDENYLRPAAVAIGSAYLWASAPERVVVHVLTCDVSKGVWKNWLDDIMPRLPKSATVIQHPVDMCQFEKFSSWHASKATYARLNVEKILSAEKWCVYCDCDTLFADDPLELLDLFDDSVALIGHQDHLLSNARQVEWFRRQSILIDFDKYVCAGFLCVNLMAFRDDELGEKCVQFIAAHPDINFPDQDALNFICQGRIKLAPNRWGLFSWEAFSDGQPGLIHYVADLPWKLMRSAYLDLNDAQRLWFIYAKMLYGWKPRDLIIDFRAANYVRRVIFGGCFRFLSYLLRLVHATNVPAIGRYCAYHYAERRLWRKLVDKRFYNK